MLRTYTYSVTNTTKREIIGLYCKSKQYYHRLHIKLKYYSKIAGPANASSRRNVSA